MNNLFMKAILEYQLFTKNDLLLLAVSGGVDSMVLFDLCLKNQYSFVVCYIDHDKREDSFKDYLLVKECCEKNHIEFFSKKLQYPEKIKNFQDYARRERYRFFTEIASKKQIKHILTAHHKDDLMETILMKLERGSNLFGYAGFMPKYKKNELYFVKPLFFYDKKMIYQYAFENQISYLEDESNAKNVYRRNIYRNEIIPLLKKENPNVTEKYLDFNRQLFISFQFIRKNTLNFLGNTLNFKVSDFKFEDIAVQMDIINYIFEQLNIENNQNKIDLLLKIILNDGKKNIFQRIGNNMYMVKAYDEIMFKKLSLEPKKCLTIHNLDELRTINNEYIYFSHNKPKNSLKYLKICYNNIDFPLILRSRTDGDCLEFNFGTKKLKKFLIDKKIPLEKRDSMLLLAYQKKVIWIPELNLAPQDVQEIDGYLVSRLQGEEHEE